MSLEVDPLRIFSDLPTTVPFQIQVFVSHQILKLPNCLDASRFGSILAIVTVAKPVPTKLPVSVLPGKIGKCRAAQV